MTPAQPAGAAGPAPRLPGGRPGLRGQLLLGCTMVVLVVVLASAAAAAWFFVDRQHAAQRSRVLAIADALAIQLERIVALEIPLQDLQGFDQQCDEALDRHDGLSFAVVTVPSKLNSIIAWALLTALIFPSNSALRFLSFVMSVANLTTL